MRARVPLLAAVAVVLMAPAAAGCFRVRKVLSARTHVLGETFETGPEMVYVSYDADGPDEPGPLRHYALTTSRHGEHSSPPRLLRNATVELWADDPRRDLDVRFFVKNDPDSDLDFSEVLSVVGEISGEMPNEVVFLEDIFPKRRNPFDFYVKDLANPHGGVLLGNGDLLLIRIEDRATHEVQKVIFEYVEDGPRIGVYTNLLLSTGLAFQLRGCDGSLCTRFIDRFHTDSAFAANFTLSFSFGWRSTRAYGPLKWLGDNLAVISSFGVGAVDTFDPLNFQFDFELVAGGGFQLLDMLSLQVLFNVTGDHDNPSFSNAFLAVGFDVTAAARFGRRIVPRLFGDSSIRSFEDH